MGWAPQAGLRVGSRPLILLGPVGHRPPSRALAETLHGDIANLRASRGQVRPRGAGRHSRPPVGGNAEPRGKGEGDLGVGGQTTTASSGFPVCFRDKLQSPRGGQQSLGPSYPDTLPAPGPIPRLLHDAAKGDFAPRPAGQGSFPGHLTCRLVHQDRLPGRAPGLGFWGHRIGPALEKRGKHGNHVDIVPLAAGRCRCNEGLCSQHPGTQDLKQPPSLCVGSEAGHRLATVWVGRAHPVPAVSCGPGRGAEGLC